MKDLDQNISELSNHYSKRFEKYGDSPKSVQWSDSTSQERRFEILTEVSESISGKVLDFGCGIGDLYEFLRKKNISCEYYGVDLSHEMIEFAQKKYPKGNFEVLDIFKQDVGDTFDYIFISGVFNNLISNNKLFMETILRKLFNHVKGAIAFNSLSTYVDYRDDGLFYSDPMEVFRFCKENLSPCVTLRHDYLIKKGVIPFEYSVYVYFTDTIKTVKNSAL